MLDTEGEPLHDPEADAALFDALREQLDTDVELIERDAAINDDAFAEVIAATMDEYMRAAGRGLET
jgi:uncharacterized protein (UPF0261 family)